MLADNLLPNEPEDPGKYYILSERQIRNDVIGTAKIKKWSDKSGFYERELSWEPKHREDKTTPDQEKKMDNAFLEHGLTKSKDTNPLVTNSKSEEPS